MDASEQTTINLKPIWSVRHAWFPLLVILAAAAWWLRQAAYAQYQTLIHFLVVVFSVMAISVWFLSCGGGTRRMRRVVVGGLWLVLLTLFAIFRPVYNGDMGVYKWRLRFASDPDEQLMAIQSSGAASDWQTTPRDYPRFLGNGYWAEVHGVELETDWQAHPPKEMWRREIGAGWSSFAIVGNYAVTQEQRGEKELVSCYRVDSGEPVWVHTDVARFDPADMQGSLGGVGPRATPTIVGERVFTQGGTGIVNCLDARNGEVIWTHDTAAEFESPVAVWGKAGSPLVVDDMVIISVGAAYGDSEADSAAGQASLVAFDIETGAIRWAAGTRKASYASPVLAEFAGVRQIIVVNESWVTAHRASDGEVLWERPWEHENDHNASVAQPVPLTGNRLFLSKGYGVGASLLGVERDAEGEFLVRSLWDPPIKRVMKTKFSNVVVRDGLVYGLDDVLLACVDLQTGNLRWKKRRSPEFGHGQIMLIGDVILVLSESGELVLVAVATGRELASMQVLDDANVTWNTPAFSPPYLLVRNAREAACYQMPIKKP
jgi:outer membrane protein assembly factor BamB